jgi:hypothetical protein
MPTSHTEKSPLFSCFKECLGHWSSDPGHAMSDHPSTKQARLTRRTRHSRQSHVNCTVDMHCTTRCIRIRAQHARQPGHLLEVPTRCMQDRL